MPLFGRRRRTSGRLEGVPGLAEAATARGWQPAGEKPFGSDLGKTVHEITRVLYRAPRGFINAQLAVGDTKFTDAFRRAFDGRKVIVANAWTYIDPVLMNLIDHSGIVTVCAVELPTILNLAVQPRDFPRLVPRFMDHQTGNPAFDENFSAAGGFPEILERALTPDVQQRMMAHDDWVFRAEGYLFGCVGKGKFRSMDEVDRRVAEVMGIVTAIPESVLPRRVDHSADDLVDRMSRIEGIEDAIAFLQGLTPAERQQLARSNTPLSAFADVRTPEDAMARFQSLDMQRRMQLLAMFMRVGDEHGRG